MQNIHLDRVGIARTYFKKPKRILKGFCLWYHGDSGLLKVNGNMFVLFFGHLSCVPVTLMECYFHLWGKY